MCSVITNFYLPPERDQLSKIQGLRIFLLRKFSDGELKNSSDPIAPYLLEHLRKLNGCDADIELHTRVLWKYGHHKLVSKIGG